MKPEIKSMGAIWLCKKKVNGKSKFAFSYRSYDYIEDYKKDKNIYDLSILAINTKRIFFKIINNTKIVVSSKNRDINSGMGSYSLNTCYYGTDIDEKGCFENLKKFIKNE